MDDDEPVDDPLAFLNAQDGLDIGVHFDVCTLSVVVQVARNYSKTVQATMVLPRQPFPVSDRTMTQHLAKVASKDFKALAASLADAANLPVAEMLCGTFVLLDFVQV